MGLWGTVGTTNKTYTRATLLLPELRPRPAGPQGHQGRLLIAQVQNGKGTKWKGTPDSCYGKEAQGHPRPVSQSIAVHALGAASESD